MNRHLKEQHIFIMYVLAFAGILFVIFRNIDALWLNLLLALCWLFSFTIRNLFIYKTEKYRKYSLLTYAVEILFLLLLSIHDGGNSSKLLFCLTIADSYISCNAATGTLCAGVSFLVFILQLIVNQGLGLKSSIILIVNEVPVFIFTGLVSYLIGRIFRSNVLIEKSMEYTQVREIELKTAYNDLNKAYRNLEEMSVLKERNRIAREIHDTVGHTITTVIVEMEAGRMLAEKDTALALVKYEMAHEQASKSLEELRKSVRLLSGENHPMNLRDSVLDILEETQIHMGINIKYFVDVPEDVDFKLSGLIIRALKEGIANGIRHGKSTAFFFKLLNENHKLYFLLQDNGSGCDVINPGFGTDNMKKSVEESGGEIEFKSEAGEGFEIEFRLPLINKVEKL